MAESAALEVLQSIRVREKWMAELRRRHSEHPAPIEGGDLCLLYRAATIDVIERIMTWRSRSGSPFLVHADGGGRNYLLLLVSDFDDVAAQLHQTQRDPFLLGAPLEAVEATGDWRLDSAIAVVRTEEGLYGRWHPPAPYMIPAPISIKKRRPSNNSSIYDQEADVRQDLQQLAKQMHKYDSVVARLQQHLGGFQAEVAWMERCQTNDAPTTNAHWQRAAQLRQSALLRCGHEMTRLQAALADATSARSDLQRSMHKCDVILASIATEKKRIQFDRQARKQAPMDPIQLRKATRKRHSVIKGTRKSSTEAAPTPELVANTPTTVDPATTLKCATPSMPTVDVTADAPDVSVPNSLVPETAVTNTVLAVRPRIVHRLQPGVLPLYTLHDVAIQDRVCVLRIFVKPPQQYMPRGFVFHAVASDAPAFFLSCRMTMTQYDVLGYGATDRGFLAFSMWFCIVYDRRQRRFRLVWSGPSCPRPLRSRDTDATAICIHKQGVRWERRYVLLQLFHRTDSPTTLHCVLVHTGKSYHVVDETASELGPSLLQTLGYDTAGNLKWHHRPAMPRQPQRRRVYTGSVADVMFHVYVASNTTYSVELDDTRESYTLFGSDFNPLQTIALPMSDFGIFFDSVATFGHGKIDVDRRRWWAYLSKYIQPLTVGRFGATISGILCLVQLSLLQSKSEFQSWFHFRIFRLDTGATSELLVSLAHWLTCALAVQFLAPDCAPLVCTNCIAESTVPIDSPVPDTDVLQSPTDVPAVAIDDSMVCGEPIVECDADEPAKLAYCVACLDLIQTVVTDSSSARVCCRQHDPPAPMLVCISELLDHTTLVAIVARLDTLNCIYHNDVTEFTSDNDDNRPTVVLCAPADVGMTLASLMVHVGDWTGMVVAVVPRYVARDTVDRKDSKDADLLAQIKRIDAAIDDVRYASPVPQETISFDTYLTSEALVMEAALACCRTSTQRTYKAPTSVVGASSWPFAARFLSEPSSLFTEMSLDIDWLTLPSTLAFVLLVFYRHEEWQTIDPSLLKPPFKVLFKALDMGMLWLQTIHARGGLLTEPTSHDPRIRIVRL